MQKEYWSVGGSKEQGSGNMRLQGCQWENPIILDHTHPHACICDCMPIDGHGEHTPKIIIFMKACEGHTRMIFLTPRPI